MNTKQPTTKRPPVVVIMGHVDHGKSTLLDYIRKTNIVATEAGNITQSISAYEVTHEYEGQPQRITFVDTPGHEAFSGMRTRGAHIADIAILIVSAEEGIKPQTKEAIKIIHERKVPYVVAISKIDVPNASPDKVKRELSENEIFVEGYGGDIPCALISSKTGEGISDLLSIILLTAELEELKGDSNIPAEGFIIESHRDTKRGISATLLIKNGVLKKGNYLVADNACAGTRIFESTSGEALEEATFSSPVAITGWNVMPNVGSPFKTRNSKREAEKESLACMKLQQKNGTSSTSVDGEEEMRAILPIIVRADTVGSLEAIKEKIYNLENEFVLPKIIAEGVGNISESDAKLALADKRTVVIAFRTDIDKKADEMLNDSHVVVQKGDIIYHLTEWLEKLRDDRKQKVETIKIRGALKILRYFSSTKDKHIAGGKVTSGIINVGDKVRIMRREVAIGQGKITNLQRAKADVQSVNEGEECGIMISSKIEIASNDVIESFVITLE